MTFVLLNEARLYLRGYNRFNECLRGSRTLSSQLIQSFAKALTKSAKRRRVNQMPGEFAMQAVYSRAYRVGKDAINASTKMKRQNGT